MTAQRTLLLAIACLACIGWIHTNPPSQTKSVVGQTATIGIGGTSLSLLARVDTGARTTSIHAESIEIRGQAVRFQLKDENGQRVVMERPIVKKANVRNAVGQEERVFVELTLDFNGHSKPLLVNLRDRSRMTYRLLLGRNWLDGDYLVDVSRKPDEPQSAHQGVTGW